MAENTTLNYKGRPLVRRGNELYYGKPDEPYVVFIQILSSTDSNGLPLADKVHVQLLSNDKSLAPRARVAKESDKSDLYSALEIGTIWLERAMSDK